MARIVIVEDDPDIRALLADILGADGHETRLARDGQEGLALVAAELPDLVVSDVEMPVLTGPELASLMMLRDQGAENIPIVLTSGVPALERVAEAVGTPYYLAKPYTVEPLLSLVARSLAERTPPAPRRSP